MRRIALALLVASASVAQGAPVETPTPKSRAVAVGLSLGTTLTGIGLVAAWGAHRDDRVSALGVFVSFIGPSTGRWYAGDGSLSGLGVRALAGVATVGLFGLLFADNSCDYDTEPCNQTPERALLITGAAVWLGSSAYDIVMADRAARDHNARFTLAPMRVQTPSGGATGLALVGTF